MASGRGLLPRQRRCTSSNGLPESNRSNFTGTELPCAPLRRSVPRRDEATCSPSSLFGSWQLRDDYDASLVYHKFWRVDGNKPVSSNGITAAG